MKPFAGYVFVHKTRLDTTWKPDPCKGEKYTDAPKEVMRVTRVTTQTVWFGPIGASKADTRMDRQQFEREYPVA